MIAAASVVHVALRHDGHDQTVSIHPLYVTYRQFKIWTDNIRKIFSIVEFQNLLIFNH